MTRAALVVFFTGSCAGLLRAQPAIEFEGRYWMPQMSSRLLVERNGVGTEVDAKNDLGISDENFPQGQVTWHTWGRSQFRFAYTPIGFSGDQTVSRTIVFGGKPYTVGTRIQSDLDIKHLQLGWSYQFSLDEGLVRIGPLVEADGFLLHGRLIAPNLGIEQSEDLSVGLPAVGLALEVRVRRGVNVYGQASGLKVGDYGYFIGSDAGVRVGPWKHLLFSAGYRTFNLRVIHSADFARMQLRGPYVGAGFAF